MLLQRGGVQLDGRDSGNQRVDIGNMRAVLRNARAHALADMPPRFIAPETISVSILESVLIIIYHLYD